MVMSPFLPRVLSPERMGEQGSAVMHRYRTTTLQVQPMLGRGDGRCVIFACGRPTGCGVGEKWGDADQDLALCPARMGVSR